MKILILGDKGFVGSNVRLELSNSNHEIIGLSKRSGIDLTNLSDTCKSFKEIRPDVIVNCAALVGSLNYVTKSAADILDINMRMLLNIFHSIQKETPESVLINPIANCAYPGNLDSYIEDRFWDGKVHQSVYSYGNTRRMIEVLSTCYMMQHGMKVINYFTPNMYGPYDSTDPNKAHALDALISKVLKAMKDGKEELEVWGSGIAVREWLYAGDFAKIILHTINDIETYIFKEPVNIAQNGGLSIRELVSVITKETNYNGKIIWNKEMPDGAPRKVMDDVLFRKRFPEFKFTTLNQGIANTVKYYNDLTRY